MEMKKVILFFCISVFLISANECVDQCLTDVCGFTDFDCIQTIADDLSCLKNQCSISDYKCIQQCCQSKYCNRIAGCLRNCATKETVYEQAQIFMTNKLIEYRNKNNQTLNDNKSQQYLLNQAKIASLSNTPEQLSSIENVPSNSDNELQQCPSNGLFLNSCILECYSNKCDNDQERKQCYSNLYQEYNCLQQTNNECCSTSACNYLLQCYVQCSVEKQNNYQNLNQQNQESQKSNKIYDLSKSTHKQEQELKTKNLNSIPHKKTIAANQIGLGSCIEQCFRNECKIINNQDVCYFDLGKEIQCSQNQNEDCCNTDSCTPLLHCFVLCSCNDIKIGDNKDLQNKQNTEQKEKKKSQKELNNKLNYKLEPQFKYNFNSLSNILEFVIYFFLLLIMFY